MKLTKQEARAFVLRHQCLLPPRTLPGPAGALEYIRRVGSIQFDPLNQVGYNPQLVLQSRVKGYKPAMLNNLLYHDRSLVDGFDKCLCIYPVEDWPAFAHQREGDRQWYAPNFADTPEALEETRRAVAERGPLCSADLPGEPKVRWPWGPASVSRAALEYLYFTGDFVIHHKEGTRKYYDLAERHLPQRLLTAPYPHHGDGEYHRWHVLRRVGSVGLLWNRASDAWLGVKNLKNEERTAAFTALLNEEALVPAEVEGLQETLYLRAEDLPLLDAPPPDDRPEMAFLAPLDNMLWDRRLVEALFGFHYRWEVYTPAAQRQYGYYVVPVLYGDQIVARFEPRLNKKTGTLELLHWWWEDGVRPNRAMKAAFRRCLKHFMAYLGAKDVTTGDGCEWMGL